LGRPEGAAAGGAGAAATRGDAAGGLAGAPWGAGAGAEPALPAPATAAKSAPVAAAPPEAGAGAARRAWVIGPPRVTVLGLKAPEPPLGGSAAPPSAGFAGCQGAAMSGSVESLGVGDRLSQSPPASALSVRGADEGARCDAFAPFSVDQPWPESEPTTMGM